MLSPLSSSTSLPSRLVSSLACTCVLAVVAVLVVVMA